MAKALCFSYFPIDFVLNYCVFYVDFQFSSMQRGKRVYENKMGDFITGIDILSEVRVFV